MDVEVAALVEAWSQITVMVGGGGGGVGVAMLIRVGVDWWSGSRGRRRLHPHRLHDHVPKRMRMHPSGRP